ncbi:armadillo-type protein [Mycena vulgaris]|nr:armadillo-type protein [Mycena vulgaris]
MDIWQKEHDGERHTVVQRAWYFVSQKPVLTLGSIHLSLMGALGLWLWSDRSKFGLPINKCDPSLSVVGGAVPFSSPGLRIFSLTIYTLLVIPGLNLVLPFLFFLALHITYNTSRLRHPHFWRRLEDLVELIRRIPRIDFHRIVRHTASTLRGIPRSASSLFRRCRRPFRDVESGIQSADASSGPPLTLSDTPPHNQATQAGDPLAQSSLNHTGFLIVGLVCLALINIIQLVDIELTLLRNRRDQSREENEWGFGQVLAFLLLVVPLRDFVTSILDIQEKVKEEKVAREGIQQTFKDHLQRAVKDKNFDGHDFIHLIERGADPTVELEGALQVKTLLQLAAYLGNEGLVRYLKDKHVKDKGAARNHQFGTAYLLKDGNKSNMAEMTRRMFALGTELLQDSEWTVRQAAIDCLSSLGAQADLQQEIRPAVSGVVKLLEDSDKDVRRAAINCLASLGAQAELQQEIRPAISRVVKLLEDSDKSVRWAAIDCLASLGAQAELQQEIRPAISGVVKLLEDSDWDVRRAAIDCLSSLGAQADLQQEIRPGVSGIVKSLEDSDWDVRRAAINWLSSLRAQGIYSLDHVEPLPYRAWFIAEFQQEVRPAISRVVKLLEDSDENVRWAAINCLAGLGAQVELQQEITPAISEVVKLLEDSDKDVRWATIDCLAGLGAQADLQQEIRPGVPGIVKLLEDSDWHVRRAAINCLAGLGAQVELQQEITPAISEVVKLLEDSAKDVRWPAIDCLASLGAQVELQQEIRPAISGVVKLLEDSDKNVRRAAINCLASLGPQVDLQQEIRPAISGVVKLLEDSDWDVRRAAIDCLASLGAEDPARTISRVRVFPICLLSLHAHHDNIRARSSLVRPLFLLCTTDLIIIPSHLPFLLRTILVSISLDDDPRWPISYTLLSSLSSLAGSPTLSPPSRSSTHFPTPHAWHPQAHAKAAIDTRPHQLIIKPHTTPDDTSSASYPALARQTSTYQRTQGYVPGASAGPMFVPDPTAGVGAPGCYVLTSLGRASLLHLEGQDSLHHTHILPEATLPRSLGIASANTARNLETCGLLLQREIMRTDTKSWYVVERLLVPKRHATSATCALDEERVLSFTEACGLMGELVLTPSLALPCRFPSRSVRDILSFLLSRRFATSPAFSTAYRARGRWVDVNARDHEPRARGGDLRRRGWFQARMACVCRRASGGDERPSACGTANRRRRLPMRAWASLGSSVRRGRSCATRRAIHGAGWPSQTTSAIVCVRRGLVAPAAPILQPAPSSYRGSSWASLWMSPSRPAPTISCLPNARGTGDRRQGYEALALIRPHDHPARRIPSRDPGSFV